MSDSTRDAEIEALAERIYVASFAGSDAGSLYRKPIGLPMELSQWPLVCAVSFIDARDAWRERRKEATDA